MVGYLARSLMGHDKDKVYVILRESEKHVLMSDGQKWAGDTLKKKNKKHIQIIKVKCPTDNNESIKQCIGLYNNRRTPDVKI